MKIKSYHLSLSAFLLFLCAVLASCSGSKSAESKGDVIYQPKYASGFIIKGLPDSRSTIIEVRNPWQGADNVTQRLFIARDGEKAPEGFDGQVLRGDARRVVAMSSTHVAMLDAFGEAGRIVGVSGRDYISNPKIAAKGDSVGDVGFEGSINYEQLVALRPDIVLLYGVKGASSMETKLRELGIPYMYVGDYVEEDPLGKAEWLVALSELTGRRESGEKVFSEIPVRYDALKKRVSDAGLKAPKVMINTPYGDSWFMPSVTNYSARLIKDAGGDYVYSKNTGNNSEAIDLEEAFLLASEADVWINPGQCRSLADFRDTCPKFMTVPAVANGRIFNNNLRMSAGGGNDYFESAVVRPDLVLRDLIKIFYPSLVREDFTYYRQLK